MTAFKFVFPLFGLLVGRSFAEMLAALARALKNKRHIRVGWLTPAARARDPRQPDDDLARRMGHAMSLLFILVVGGSYFVAASLVFPSTGADVRDLDDHFMANGKLALLVIAGGNLLYLVRTARKTGARTDAFGRSATRASSHCSCSPLWPATVESSWRSLPSWLRCMPRCSPSG